MVTVSTPAPAPPTLGVILQRMEHAANRLMQTANAHRELTLILESRDKPPSDRRMPPLRFPVFRGENEDVQEIEIATEEMLPDDVLSVFGPLSNINATNMINAALELHDFVLQAYAKIAPKTLTDEQRQRVEQDIIERTRAVLTPARLPESVVQSPLL